NVHASRFGPFRNFDYLRIRFVSRCRMKDSCIKFRTGHKSDRVPILRHSDADQITALGQTVEAVSPLAIRKEHYGSSTDEGFVNHLCLSVLIERPKRYPLLHGRALARIGDAARNDTALFEVDVYVFEVFTFGDNNGYPTRALVGVTGQEVSRSQRSQQVAARS